MENAEIVEASVEEFNTNVTAIALGVVAATAVGVGAVFVGKKIVKKFRDKKTEKELWNEAEEAAQN